jgi:hypothetical protein
VDTLRKTIPKATGSGIKVGVISDSVTYLSQVQGSGDLPPVTVLPGNEGTGRSEGTAMLEIIYDLAPQAKLYFSAGGLSQPAFALNIIALADAGLIFFFFFFSLLSSFFPLSDFFVLSFFLLQTIGCKVIVDDIIFFGEPVYEDGPIAQAIDQVAARGVAYFSSAGNYGSQVYATAKVWEGDYRAAKFSLPSASIGNIYLDVHSFTPTAPHATLTGSFSLLFSSLLFSSLLFFSFLFSSLLFSLLFPISFFLSSHLIHPTNNPLFIEM